MPRMRDLSVLVLMCATVVWSNPETFRNPILEGGGPDPWILRYNGTYLLTYTMQDRVTVYQSSRLDDWRDATSVTAFAPQGKEFTEIWAPETHFIQDNLYIYYTANPGEGHRMFALQADDPAKPLGTWTWKGRIFDPEQDLWAIDGTVLQHANGKLYFIWVGGLSGNLTLFISEMSDPVTVVSGSSVILNQPSLPWEMNSGNVSEGPAVITSGDNYYVVYSGSSTWSDDYCLGMLRIHKTADPMERESWHKYQDPVFTKNTDEEVFGPGHASFTVSPDGTERWMVYHAMNQTFAEGNLRTPRIQRFTTDSDGTPVFPKAAGYGRELPLPSGSVSGSGTRFGFSCFPLFCSVVVLIATACSM